MTEGGNVTTIGEPKIQVEELDQPDSTDADNQFLDFGDLNKNVTDHDELKSKGGASFRTGGSSRKPRKGLFVENSIVHAHDFKTA